MSIEDASKPSDNNKNIKAKPRDLCFIFEVSVKVSIVSIDFYYC